MSFWDQLVDRVEAMGSTIGEWAPKILLAIVVLIVGRWILKIIRTWIEKLLNLPAVQTVFERAGITSALSPSGRSPAGLAATLVYAFLLVVLWLIVFQILEIDAIVALLERLLAFLPLVFVAVALVIIAAAVGNYVADLVRPYAEQRQVQWLPSAVRILVLVFGVLAALDLLEIRFAEDIVKIVTAAAGIAFAVAFGVGGIDTAKKWWAKYLSPREG